MKLRRRKVALVIPKARKAAVEQWLAQRGVDFSFVSRWSDDGGKTHTHYAAHGEVPGALVAALAERAASVDVRFYVTEREFEERDGRWDWDITTDARTFARMLDIVPFEEPV